MVENMADIERGLGVMDELEKSKFEILEMPSQKILEDFLKGAFGEEEITVVFSTEEGRFIRLPKEREING